MIAPEIEKIEHVDGKMYRYRTAWSTTLESELHWRLYWRQQKIMKEKVLPKHTVLEIGVGTGFTANYLRSKGVKVTTIDIDAGKKPDIVSNIVTYDFNHIHDHILAFEVFEHIPYMDFEQVLRKLSRACRHFLFLSVPRNEKVLAKATVKLPWFNEFEVALRVPRRKIITEYHYWEVDHPETPRRKFEQTLWDAGFSIAHYELAFSRFFYVVTPAVAQSN